MKYQNEEVSIYTAIGQIIKDSLAHKSIEDAWDKVVLKVEYTHGVINYEAERIWNGVPKSMGLIPDPYRISDVVKELHEFTESNDYTPWNRFTFELNKNHSFEINFAWDQELNDKYAKWA